MKLTIQDVEVSDVEGSRCTKKTVFIWTLELGEEGELGDLSSLEQHPTMRAALEDAVKEIPAQLKRYFEQVGRYMVTHRFSVDADNWEGSEGGYYEKMAKRLNELWPLLWDER